MRKKILLIVLCIIGIAGIVNAQVQVSKEEATNAAINTLRNKEDVLKRSSDTEIDTVYSFTNNKNSVLTSKNKERRKTE